MSKRTILTWAAAAAFFVSAAHADVGIDGAFVLSDGLGYEQTGFGVQLDIDHRSSDWGFDAEATALRHPKLTGEGERFQVIAMGRRWIGPIFLEAGIEHGGYQTRFADGSEWVKYGTAFGGGIGTVQGDKEFTLRYFAPDSTPNNTSIFTASVETPINAHWVAGLTLEVWKYDLSGDRRKGRNLMFQLGYRF